eukprot:scaffold659_cov329-Prasinococcus_capsulatus_cf.AAC.9
MLRVAACVFGRAPTSGPFSRVVEVATRPTRTGAAAGVRFVTRVGIVHGSFVEQTPPLIAQPVTVPAPLFCIHDVRPRRNVHGQFPAAAPAATPVQHSHEQQAPAKLASE